MQQIMHVRRVVQSNHCHKNLETPPTDTLSIIAQVDIEILAP